MACGSECREGIKSWQVKYTADGKETTVTLPRRYGPRTDEAHLSLEDARHEASAIRALARSGVDFRQKVADQREAEKVAREKKHNESMTLRDLFDAWFPEISTKRGKKGRIGGGAETLRCFEKDVFPALGDMLLTQITKADVLRTVRRVSSRGANRLAVLIVRDIRQVFRWGNANQPWKRLLIDSDVLAIVDSDVVGSDYDPVSSNERDRVLDENEIRHLAKLLPVADLSFAIQSAVWLMLSCGTRVGETVAARWSHVDLENHRWHIPAESAKSNVALDVTLSDFAHARFTALRGVRDRLSEEKRSDWVFPSRKDISKPLDNQTIGKQLADRQRPGKKPLPGRTERVDALVLAGGQWKCHDLRRSCGTLMQSLGVPESTIHRCLNHARTDKLDRIYLQHDYSTEMANAWRVLGQRLELLTRTDVNVITAQFGTPA